MSSSDRATIRVAADWFTRLQGPEAGDIQGEFEAWLAASAENRQAYNRVAETFSLGKNLRFVQMSARPLARRSAGSRIRGKVMLAVALTLTGVVLGAFAARWLEQERVRSSTVGAPAPLELATRIGEIRSFHLSDGTLVTLDTDSEMKEDFSSRRRDVSLVRGRARFDVAHETRPFVVHAGQSMVTAHGTLFDVRLDGSRIAVRLLRGAIDVAMPAAASPERRLIKLEPGEAVVADVALGITRLGGVAAPVLAQTEWPAALLDFDHISVRDLAAEANRYSAEKIIVDDGAVGAMTVSGTFKVNDPQRLAAHLALLLDLRLDHAPNGDITLTAAKPQ